MKRTDIIFRDIYAAFSAYATSLTEAKHTFDSATSNLSPEDFTQAYIEHKRAEAREAAAAQVDKAIRSFSDTLSSKVSDLEKVLSEHFTESPSQGLLDTLSVYQRFGIAPGRIELEGLLKETKGQSLAVRCVNSVLEQTHSPYRIQTHDLELEADLRLLKSLAEKPSVPTLDLISFVSDVTGKEFSNSLISSSSFRSAYKELEPMAQRWDSTIPPTITALHEYADRNDPETGRLITAEQQIEVDRQKAIVAAQISKPIKPGSIAEKLGQQVVEAEATRQKALAAYGKG